jgi:hypothetical protein
MQCRLSCPDANREHIARPQEAFQTTCACFWLPSLQSVNAWFGPPGTVTPLHTDPHHNLLCQVVGSKYIRLYTPGDTPAMYPFR